MSILMQAFYWDCPRLDKREHDWWNFVASKVPELSESGIDALWLPPISKASDHTSMGTSIRKEARRPGTEIAPNWKR